MDRMKDILLDNIIEATHSRMVHRNMGTASVIGAAHSRLRTEELETMAKQSCLLQIPLLQAAFPTRMLPAN
jgi:hypothetical protein